jgi:hypothetical protein
MHCFIPFEKNRLKQRIKHYVPRHGEQERNVCRRSRALFERFWAAFHKSQAPGDAAHERPDVGALHGGWPDQDADQVQVRVRVRAFRATQRGSTNEPPGQPLGRAWQEQWLRAREERCARRTDQVRIRNRLTGSREDRQEEDGAAPQRDSGKGTPLILHLRMLYSPPTPLPASLAPLMTHACFVIRRS